MSIRVQITRQPTVQSIDGIQIETFRVGEVYDVGTSIGALLLAEGWAVPVPLDEAAPPEHFSEKDPNLHAPYRDPDAPPNLTREHYPPYLDQRSQAAAIERRHRPRRRK